MCFLIQKKRQNAKQTLHVSVAIWRPLPGEDVSGSQEVLGIPAWLTPESLILGSPTNQLGKDCRLRQVVVLLDVIRCALQIVLGFVSADDHHFSSDRTCFLGRKDMVVNGQSDCLELVHIVMVQVDLCEPFFWKRTVGQHGGELYLHWLSHQLNCLDLSV